MSYGGRETVRTRAEKSKEQGQKMGLMGMREGGSTTGLSISLAGKRLQSLLVGLPSLETEVRARKPDLEALLVISKKQKKTV